MLRQSMLISSLSLLLSACDLFNSINTTPQANQPLNSCDINYTKPSKIAHLNNNYLARLQNRLSSNQFNKPNIDLWNKNHIKGQLLLLKHTNTSLSKQQVNTLKNLQISQISPNISVVQTPKNSTDLSLAQHLAKAGFYVQPNYIYKAASLTNDAGFPRNSGIMIAKKIKHQDYLTKIKIPEAWQYLFDQKISNQGALTAVIDTGVTYDHEDLQKRLLNGCSYDLSGKSSEGAQEVPKSNTIGHGIANVGVISANTNNKTGLAGITWTSKNILPIKVFDFNKDGEFIATSASLTSGILYAVKQNAKVINMSLGEIGFGDIALDRALLSASQSAVLVASAGNTSEDGIYSPARHSKVISVGGITTYNTLTCYSARPNDENPRILDLVAPSGDAGSSKSVTNSKNSKCIQSSSNDILTLTSIKNSSGYALRSGTSIAAPMVSGVASLLLGAFPKLSPTKAKEILIDTAQILPQSNGRVLRLVDAEAAVKKAARISSP